MNYFFTKKKKLSLRYSNYFNTIVCSKDQDLYSFITEEIQKIFCILNYFSPKFYKTNFLTSKKSSNW